jgi:hypothetical protein
MLNSIFSQITFELILDNVTSIVGDQNPWIENIFEVCWCLLMIVELVIERIISTSGQWK